ncbi:MAG: O-antigen ligase family protein, partial [Fusobacterium sp.]|nr:O-antigen ligase family protein [Fusobacterium sp.]
GIFSLILNNSRAPLLSFVLGILFYLIFSKKIKTLLFIIGFFLFVLMFQNIVIKSSFFKEFSNRVETISIIDSGGNAARLFMWKENMNFMLDSFKNNKKVFLFGTGIKNREIPFKEYLTNKMETKELEKVRRWGVSFIDAHNAYLNMLVQTGVPYTIIYYLTLLYFTIKVFFNFLTSKNEYTLSCLTAMGAFYFSGIFYGYSFTYETFLFFFVLSLGLTKKLMDNNSGINDSE